MDFFNNQGNNSKDNEVLLDAIMQEQKKREKKHNISKGYLLNKKVGMVSNPFDDKLSNVEAQEIKAEARDFKHKPVDTSNGQPLFVVGGRYKSKKQMSKKAKVTILVASLLAVIMVVAAFCAVFFLSKHKFDIVCGNMEGIAIYDKDNKEIDSIALRMYESFTFKVAVKENYSNSKIEVWYNDKQLIADKNGFYTIKFVGETTTLRVMGVVENDYNVVFDSNSSFNYVLTKADGSKENLNGKTKTNFYGNKLEFTLFDAASGLTLPQHVACVYDNGTLLTPNSNGVYTLSYNKHHNIIGYYHSPFEYFDFEAVFNQDAPDSVASYKLVKLSEIGRNQTIISLPKEYNGVPVSYDFNSKDAMCSTTAEIIVFANSPLNSAMFDNFTDLQKITVKDATPISAGFYSENGLLYQNQETALIDGDARIVNHTNVLVKVPMGIGKNLAVGERVWSINPDMIAEGAIYRLNYVRTLNIGEKTSYISPLAFKGTSIGSEYNYTININENNTHYVAENNVIYSADKKQIVSAQFASGEFVVADNTVVLDNAFSYSEITTLKFAGRATLAESAMQNMRDVTKIVMPSNIGSIKLGMLFGCDKLVTIDLTNVTGTITIDEMAADLGAGWSNIKIVIVDANINAYRTAFAGTALENCFVAASEFYA